MALIYSVFLVGGFFLYRYGLKVMARKKVEIENYKNLIKELRGEDEA